MNKAGERTRRRGWSKVGRALRTPKVALLILGVVAAETGLIVGCYAIARVVGFRTNNADTAFVLGAVVSAALVVLTGVVAIAAGGVNWITGGWAEQWTGRRLRALGPDWWIVHNLVFRWEAGGRSWEYDVDHVAVGPAGVLVVESKYSSREVDIESPHLGSQTLADAQQAWRSARSIRRVLEDSGVRAPVIPVLVYWGFRVQLPRNPIRNIGRVQVVFGADATRWSGLIGSEKKISSEAIDLAWRALSDYSYTNPP